jgi:hypothetical protein
MCVSTCRGRSYNPCFICKSQGNGYLFLNTCKQWTSNGFTCRLDSRYNLQQPCHSSSRIINIVWKSCRKHFWIVFLMICFPLGSDKVMIVLHCWVSGMWWRYFSIVSRPFKCFAHSIDRRYSEANLRVKYDVFVSVSEWQAKIQLKC